MAKSYNHERDTDMSMLMPSTHGAFFMNGADPKKREWHYVWDNENEIPQDFFKHWLTRLEDARRLALLTLSCNQDVYFCPEDQLYCPMGAAFSVLGVSDDILSNSSTPSDFPEDVLRTLPRDLVSRIGTTVHTEVENAPSYDYVVKIIKKYAKDL